MTLLGGMCEAKEERLRHGQHLGRMCEANEDDMGGKCEATEGAAETSEERLKTWNVRGD